MEKNPQASKLPLDKTCETKFVYASIPLGDFVVKDLSLPWDRFVMIVTPSFSHEWVLPRLSRENSP